MSLSTRSISIPTSRRPARRAAHQSSPLASVTPVLALLGPSIGFKLKIAKADYRGDAIAGIDIDIERRAGTLALNQVRVASLAGARIAVRGAIANYWTPQPQADFAYDIQASDIDRVLKLAGGKPTGIGALSLRGGIGGSWDRLTLRDCALSTMGWSMVANGVLALPGRPRGAIKSVRLQGQDRRQRPADRCFDRYRPLGRQAGFRRRYPDR